MEKFQEQVLQRLARIENAVEILIDRISNLEHNSSQTDGELWEELRTAFKDWLKTCDKKRKAIHEITQDRSDRLEKRLKEDLGDLEEKIKRFEEKVFSVEKEVTAGETTTRDVFSLQSKVESLGSCVTQNKISLGVIESSISTQSGHLGTLENRFDERGKHWSSLLVAIVSALIALGVLGYMIFKDGFPQ